MEDNLTFFMFFFAPVKEMLEFYLQANLVIFNAVISSVGESAQWRAAIHVLQDLQGKNLDEEVIMSIS